MEDVGEDHEGEDEEWRGVGWYEEEWEPAVLLSINGPLVQY
jgi:hypothetical protein